MSGPVAAILLAAGRSVRMGSCKQLLPLGDRTVIARCLEALLKGGIGEVVAVVSPEGREVAEVIGGYPVRVVVNTEAAGDMSSSVRAGRDALADEASGVIVSLCDYPLVTADTIVRLVEGYVRYPGSIITPCHQGLRGHPLLFPRVLLNGLSRGQILRDLVRQDPQRHQCLNVDDPGVLIDMDTPEDYHRICGMFESAGFPGPDR